MPGLWDVVFLIGADLVLGAAVLGTTAAAARGRLKLNSWSGIRIPSTMTSQQAWLAAHRAALPWMSRAAAIAGVGALAAGVMAATGRYDAGVVAAMAPLFLVLVALIPAVRAASAAGRAAEAARVAEEQR